MDTIFILKEVTRFNYGKIMWEKYFYYKTNKSAYVAKIQFEETEQERVALCNQINKKKYSDRTGNEICFDSNNGFYKKEYSVSSSKIINTVD